MILSRVRLYSELCWFVVLGISTFVVPNVAMLLIIQHFRCIGYSCEVITFGYALYRKVITHRISLGTVSVLGIITRTNRIGIILCNHQQHFGYYPAFWVASRIGL